MKKSFFLIALCFFSVCFLASCSRNPSERAAEGAVVGAAAGVLAGGVLGGSPQTALVGGAIGAASGSVIGAMTAPGKRYKKKTFCYYKRHVRRCEKFLVDHDEDDD